MAIYFKKIRNSGLPELSKADFLAAIQPGDLLFVSGTGLISDAIKFEEHSPFSHVAMLFTEQMTGKVLVLESKQGCGVRVGSFIEAYLDSNQPLAIGRYQGITPAQVTAALGDGFGTLDDGYDLTEDVEIAAHNILSFIPVHPAKKRYICSATVAYVLGKVGAPLDPQKGGDTPASIWQDRHIVGVAALVR